jgi:hypothetical protein
MGNDYLITEKPLKSLLVFSFPMMIGNLFQQFYTMADSAIVGRFVSEQALAAVGASYALTNIFILIIDKPFWNSDFCFVVSGFYMAGDNLFAFGLTFKAGQPYEYTEYPADKSLFKIYKGPSREKICADYAAATSRLAARRKKAEPKSAPSEEEQQHILPDVLNRKRVFTPTCDNCQLKANETCFGQKGICGDFKMIPYVSEEEKEAWPAYGDATAIMLQDHSHW